MAELSATTVATVQFVAGGATVPVLAAFGVPLGLRVDFLVAGFAGSLAAMILLNAVPATGDTWRHLMRDTVRRMAVMLASSLTAGYATPNVALLSNLPPSIVLGVAFTVGGGAQHVLGALIRRRKREAEHGKEETQP